MTTKLTSVHTKIVSVLTWKNMTHQIENRVIVEVSSNFNSGFIEFMIDEIVEGVLNDHD